MFKLILIASALAIAISVNSFEPKQVIKPIAMVKYKDIIYHCQSIIKTDCGHSLHCGDMSMHCVMDFDMEYLQ